MRKFAFKLEGVLRQRKQIEQQRQRDLAITAQSVRQAEQELRDLDQSLKSAAAGMRQDHLIGKLDMAFIAAHRRFSAAMERKGQTIVQRLAGLQRQAEAQQKLVAEAAKRRKAIEKLKERRKELWLAEEARRETADLDEISNQMAFHQLMEATELSEGAA